MGPGSPKNGAEADASELGVWIVGATSLRISDRLTKKSDPYCKLRIVGKRSWPEVKTEVIKANLNPTWNQFVPLDKFAQGETLEFEVWDKDRFTPDDILGRTTLRLGAKLAESQQAEFEQELDLVGGDEHSKLKVRLRGIRPAFDWGASRPVATLADSNEPGTATGAASASERPTPAAAPEAPAAPEELLVRSDPQIWALVLLVLAEVFAVLHSGKPLSCVHSADDKDFFGFEKCSGLLNFEDGVSPRLPNFCWQACSRGNLETLLLLIGLAIFLQASIVILNVRDFNGWFRWTFYIDLWDFLPQVNAAAESAQVPIAAAAEGIERNAGFVQRQVLRLVRKPLAKKIERTVMGTQKQVGAAATYDAAGQSSSKQLVLPVKAFVALALLHVGYRLFSGVSKQSSFFACAPKSEYGEKWNRHEMVAMLRRVELLLLCACEACLLLGMWIIDGAKWAMHVRVKPSSNSQTGQSAARRLKEHLARASCDDDDNPTEASASTPFDSFKSVKGSQTQEYVPNLKRGFPEDDFLSLLCVKGMALHGIRYDGILYTGKQEIANILEKECFPRKNDGSEEMSLLFRRRGKETWVTQLRDLVLADPHRAAAAWLLGASAIGMVVSFSCCWLCAQTVNVAGDENITVDELSERLSLLGSCGSHTGVGSAVFLAGLALAVAAVQQIVILLVVKERCDAGYTSGVDDGQLRFKVLDFRKNSNLNIERFEQGYQKMRDEDDELGDADCDDEEPPEVVMCYLWVRPNADGSEDVVNADGFGHRRTDVERRQWRRSSQPRKVRLVKISEKKRQSMSKGLIGRADVGLPTICVEVLTANGERSTAERSRLSGSASLLENTGSPASPSSPLAAQPSDGAGYLQMIPVEFIAGFFHAEVNLGPKQVWELMSRCLSLSAAALALLDILRSMFGESRILASCRDVHNQVDCRRFHIEDWGYDGEGLWGREDRADPIGFRRSLGPYVAALSTMSCLLGTLVARAAELLRDEDRAAERSAGDVVRVYLGVLGEGSSLACRLAYWSCTSFRAGVRNTYFFRNYRSSSGLGASHEAEPYEALLSNDK